MYDITVMGATLRNVIIGAVSGLLVAIGGATKDAPYEGFKTKTFLRSPLIGAVVTPIIGAYVPGLPPVILALSTIAVERASVETYKLYRQTRGEYVPGKFTYGEWGCPLPNQNAVFYVRPSK